MANTFEFPLPGMLIDGPSGTQTIKLGNPIGEGAFGVVFEGFETGTNRRFAIKFPRLGALASQKELLSFFNEVASAKTIDHPNVVKVLFTPAETERIPYLVLEYVRGGNLRTHIDNSAKTSQPIPADLLEKWFDELIQGMTAINATVLHRDLHPGNILISDGNLKIGDFGLSKAIGAATRSNTFKGGQHIFYMAPEGWNSEKNTIQLDMYSLGIILFELMTLNYPYPLPPDPRIVEDFREMHLFQAPAASQKHRPDIPPGIHQAVHRLLEKKPENRFASWKELAEKLATSWRGAPETRPVRPVLAGILQESLRIHQLKMDANLKLAREREIAANELKMDDHQRKALLDEIKGIVDEYNGASSIDKITVAELGHRLLLRSANAGEIKIDFFTVTPPVRLRDGQTFRYAGAIGFANEAGINLLLLRNGSSDLYGRWHSCLVRTSATVQSRRRAEPFCFSTREEIREIGLASNSAHIYTIDIRPWDANMVFEFIAEILKEKT